MDYKQYTLGYKRQGRKDAFNEKRSAGFEERAEYLDFIRKATGYSLTISQRTTSVKADALITTALGL